MIGSRLGPYEITAKLGEGGMGEVYRATDTKLKREVALKVLPTAFTEDKERLARFEREAQLLAQLQHPNVASIYGMEEAGPTRTLVMELVEGPTLADRLSQGAIPLEESLAIAREIALALEAAHEKGIVHRDLKPQNVKASGEGAVKVLDFGLAKAMDPVGSPSGGPVTASPTLLNSPTLTAAGTQLGVILGTAAYMAPEQARGLAVDKRADIWAFGVILWEMLTGRRLFEGELVTDVLAAVLRQEVDLDALPPGTPARLRRLVRRCLERRPKERLHDVADARLVLDELLAGERDEAAPAPAPAPRRSAVREAMPWLVAAAAVAVAGFVLLRDRGPVVVEGPPAAELALAAPAGGELQIGSNAGWGVVSPDGRQIVFNAVTPEGSGLWVRPLDRAEARLLPGTSQGFYPFWSPDSRWIAFFERGSLQKIEVAGGLPERIGPAAWGRGGSWSENGWILLTPIGGGAVHRVRADGGEPTPVTELDATAGEDAHYWPVWLPDGEHFLYFIRSGRRENQGVYLGRVSDSGRSIERRRVVASSSSGLFAPGAGGAPDRLLWAQEGTLLARAFDASSGTLTGATSRIAEGVRVLESQRATMASVSRNGVLVHASAAAGRIQFAWYDRDGHGPELLPLAARDLFQPRLSPDGRWLAYVVVEGGQGDIWLLDLVTGESRALTSSAEYEEQVAWSPDSRELLVRQGGVSDGRVLRLQPSGASAPRQVTVADGVGGALGVSPISWLPGGWFVATASVPGGTQDVVALPLEGNEPPVKLLSGGHSYSAPAAAPDGRALSYRSDESGQDEGYLVGLTLELGRPELATDRQRLPIEGAREFGWRGDGRELFVTTEDRGLYAFEVDRDGGRLRLGSPRRLFDAPTNLPFFAVDPSGERFLFRIDPEAARQTLTVILDWPARLGPGEGR